VNFEKFFEIDATWRFANHFLGEKNPVFWLPKIGPALLSMLPNETTRRRPIPPDCHVGPRVFIHESVILPPVCVIEGPCYIDEGTTIRPFAYIRENVIIGKNCLVGNSCELKNSILLNHVQIPHFNYVGDSVLGNFVHLGAGVILANLRLDGKEIVVHSGDERLKTGMRKIGAIVGDHSEVACNCVINPGSALAKYSMILPKRP
jgi:NDP-sugar pyrophosphorylase family protein